MAIIYSLHKKQGMNEYLKWAPSVVSLTWAIAPCLDPYSQHRIQEVSDYEDHVIIIKDVVTVSQMIWL